MVAVIVTILVSHEVVGIIHVNLPPVLLGKLIFTIFAMHEVAHVGFGFLFGRERLGYLVQHFALIGLVSREDPNLISFCCHTIFY